MEVYIALFVSGRKSFFWEDACINCPVDKYCACDGADVFFDIEKVMNQKLIYVENGVRMTEPLKVDMGLATGKGVDAFLSHQGILAVSGHSVFDFMQFTDLKTDKQVVMRVKDWCLAGFYDNMMILLTYNELLREASVKSIFKDPTLETFKIIEGTRRVLPCTDVSLLHARRVLYYPTKDYELFSFNVDTRENTEIDVGGNICSLASFTGIDCGVKVVFMSKNDKCTYTLGMNNVVEKVNWKQSKYVDALFPSTSNPKCIMDAVFKYRYKLVKYWVKIETSCPVDFDDCDTFVRVYRDIFLGYNFITNSWFLFRMVNN